MSCCSILRNFQPNERNIYEHFMDNPFQSPFKSAHTGSKSIFRCPCDLESLHGKHGEFVVGEMETKVVLPNETRTSVSQHRVPFSQIC